MVVRVGNESLHCRGVHLGAWINSPTRVTFCLTQPLCSFGCACAISALCAPNCCLEFLPDENGSFLSLQRWLRFHGEQNLLFVSMFATCTCAFYHESLLLYGERVCFYKCQIQHGISYLCSHLCVLGTTCFILHV